jgi:hypothetical protein
LSATDRPVFRTDLVSRPVDAAGHRFIEVTDPDSGSSFRFYEVEYAIACAMDGERDIYGLASWARIELGLEPSPDELLTVIGTLSDLGYLDTGEAQVDRQAPMDRPGIDRPPPLDRPPPVGRTETPPSPFDLPPHMSPHMSPGVSTDLSEHIPVRAADVKEAVRQSRAMPAMRPPAPAMASDDDGFDDEKTPAPYRQPARAAAAAEAGMGAAGSHREAPPQVSPGLQSSLQKTLLGAPGLVPPRGPAGRSNTPPPMVLPEQPAEFGRGAPAPAPAAVGRSRSAPVSGAREPMRNVSHASSEVPMVVPRRPSALVPYLLVLLLLSVAGAVAYWWFFMREDQVGQGAQSANDSPPVAPSAVEQPPATTPVEPAAPTEVTATLEAGPTQEQEVKAPRVGRITWLAPAGGELAEGAPLAKYDGFQPPEYAVREAQESQRRYQEKLDQATAKGDKDAMKEAEGNVKRKQGDIDRHTEELDKFLVKAPAGGMVELVIKPRTNVKKDEVVAKILAQSEPRATFMLPGGYQHQGGQARVVSKADASLGANCKVEPSEAGKLVVSCPTDSGLASGAEVVLRLQ